MMAMFSVKFAYKIASTMFKFRSNNSGKTYADDLLSSTVDRVEYYLMKHILFLLDIEGQPWFQKCHATRGSNRIFGVQQSSCIL